MSRNVSPAIAAAVCAALFSSDALATNGYFMHGYSTKEKGLAGAGAAFSQDAMASATNPAGLVFVGKRLDVGLTLFSPSSRGYTVTGNPPAPAGSPVFNGSGVCQFPHPQNPAACAPPFSINPGSVDSDNDFFLIPHVAYSHPLDAVSSVGISIYGNGGMNTEYTSGSARLPAPTSAALPLTDLSGTFGAGTAGVNLEQGFLNFTYSRKLNNKHALGVSLLFVAQRFRAQGLENFGQFSLDPNNLSGNRHSESFGFGIKLGYQGEIADHFRVGVSYRPKVKMGEFDEYKGLFAGGGNFDLPSTYSLGFSYDFGKSGMLVADVQRINYSEVDSISNSVSQLTNGQCTDALNNTIANGGVQSPATGAGCLGGGSGAGFGWDDMTIIKIGYQFDVGNNTWRIGYSHANQPISSSETLFNVLAPAVITDHFTAGLTMPVGSNQEFNLAAMYAPKQSVSGKNPFDGGATTVEIEMSQWELQAAWAWKF